MMIVSIADGQAGIKQSGQGLNESYCPFNMLKRGVKFYGESSAFME